MRLWVPLIITIGFVGRTDALFGASSPDDDFFESKVRPLLISKCLECHTGDKPKAGLRLDSREAVLTGGESGPAAASGKPDESLLMDVISYRNSVQMPPKAKLPEAEIATLTEWVHRGLPWPNSKPATSNAETQVDSKREFTEEQRSFWAFQPVRRTTPPSVQHDSLTRSPVDRFILAELEAKQSTTSGEADPRTLLRRVTLDLTGLPPTRDEVAEFLADDSPDAFERVVDRLLASPRYGERWARHWLDVARYADSNGLDENLAYANAYRYRDYVVRSMRDDKPYDQFLIEQIAGDLLTVAESEQASSLASQSPSFDALIATGFLCLGAKMLAEDDPVKMQMDIIDEQVDTVARAVMGLTMGCARCHDHKFDPLTSEDYYGLAGVFKSTQTMDTFTVVAKWHERPLATLQEIEHRDELQRLASVSKQAVDKLVQENSETILAEGRQHAGAYLLAATRQLQIAEQLKLTAPRGNSADPESIAGAILIEAEDYARGNALKDRDNYGKEIGVLVNRGELPNFAEYDIDVSNAGTYQLELRHAAASSRPVKLYVNKHLIKSDAANRVTGSWNADSQAWFIECAVELHAGRNVIRLEQPQAFPHIDKLLLTPIDISSIKGFASEPEYQSAEEKPELLSSLTAQFSRVIDAPNDDPKWILTAWRQFREKKRLTIDPSSTENGVARLSGDVPPTSFGELAHRYDRLFAEAQKAWLDLKADDATKSAESLADPVLEAAHQFLMNPKGVFAVPSDIESSFPEHVVTELKNLRDEHARHEAAIPKFPETMAVADAKPENLKIHLRGSHLTLGREVPHRLPRILSGDEHGRLDNGSGRLQLGRWLTSSEHPLTARVMVNRIWQWHFGYGLVRSPDNFGRLGERPSHPELLDWLASDFSGTRSSSSRGPRAWSIKSAHRTIVTSSTYRKSTEYNAASALADPDNRLLWRFNRQRMDVEVLRDSMLSLSGLLDETPGGSMLPTANRAYVTSTASVNPATYSSRRRSIYLPVVRSALYEVFTAFDFADPSTLSGQRDQTTVAPQALFMMNSSFVLEQSKDLARHVISGQLADTAARVRDLYELVYCRSPSDVETARAGHYLARVSDELKRAAIQSDQVEVRAWTSFCRALLSANEFLYIE